MNSKPVNAAISLAGEIHHKVSGLNTSFEFNKK
jgi:hypothetical protein